jgi:hypothetical protein
MINAECPSRLLASLTWNHAHQVYSEPYVSHAASTELVKHCEPPEYVHRHPWQEPQPVLGVAVVVVVGVEVAELPEHDTFRYVMSR